MSEMRAFEASFSEDAIADLKRRLTNTRWAEAETVDDWSQGVPLAYLAEFCDHWGRDYDFSRITTQLNEFPQFITNLLGLDIHFLHVRSPVESARPLLLTHGWPGSVFEFMKVIGPLSNPEAHGGSSADAFHLVVPTLPGYGFSGKPRDAGWGLEKIAQAWNILMLQLGYDRYFAQGGDWGAGVTSEIAKQNLGNCLGIHINMPTAWPTKAARNEPSQRDSNALAAARYYQDVDSGYSILQSTRPQSIGYALANSPVAQAAWILEKFHAWTDCAGHPENVLTRDELLDNITLYWLTSAGASSARLYWESFKRLVKGAENEISLPTGCSIFPKEIVPTPRQWAEQRYKNIVYWRYLNKGGHFAAFEVPELFVIEIRDCFRGMQGN